MNTSLKLKREQFRTQIRRESVQKILRKRKEIFLTQNEVNQTFLNYLHQNIKSPLPIICALKFQFLTEENKALLTKMVIQREIELDFSKPQHITLINKISLSKEGILELFVEEITAIAEKIIFSLSGNEKLCLENHKSKDFPQPTVDMLQNIMIFPNCILEFWAGFFATTDHVLSISTYCVILKAFIYWFGSKYAFLKHFNKYSLCLFMKNFMKFQNIYFTQSNYNTFKNVEDLWIKFRIASTPLICILLEEGFLSDEFLEILKQLSMEKNNIDLLRMLSCKIERKVTFFSYLLGMLQHEQNSQKKQKDNMFFFSQQVSEKTLRTLEQYSIQKMIEVDIGTNIWQKKIQILQIMNNFINNQYYQLELLRGDVKALIERLFSIFVYCEQRGKITQKIQNRISIFIQNILMLVEDSVYEDNQQQTQQYIELKENSIDGEIFLHQKNQQSKQKLEKENQSRQTYNDVKAYFIDQIDIHTIIKKSSFYSASQTINFLSLINQISVFAHNKEHDTKILQSELISRICRLLNEKIFSWIEGESIIQGLFQFLANLHQKEFCFKPYLNQLEQLKSQQITKILSESQQSLLESIWDSFQ